MAYSVTADLQQAAGGADRLLAAADWDRDGTSDPTVLAAAIAEADGTIDSYASKQFAVPVSPVPPVFTRWSARLAVIYIRRDRGMMTEDDRLFLDVILGTKERKGELQRLADGEILPGLEPIPTKGSIVLDEASARPDAKAVSRDKLRGFW